MSLEPTTPHAAVEEYLNNLIGITQSTKNNHESRLNNFLEWCDQEGITNINEVNEQTLLTYRSWRSEQVSPITLRMCFGTVRKFIDYCETTNRVHQGTAENVDLPNVADGEDVDDTVLAVEEAQQILDYLRKYEYATRDHLIFELLWHTGIRLSALYGFDKDDYSRKDMSIKARHRPETGTALKNKKKSNRKIALTESVCEVVDDYLAQNHPGVRDDNGRMPLIGTKSGRAHRTTITKAVYKMTRPCVYSNECPVDKDPNSCEYVYNSNASGCPESVSPHPIRKGYVTKQRNNDWPVQALCDRVNMSPEVMEKHYDKGSEDEKTERRRKFLEDE